MNSQCSRDYVPQADQFSSRSIDAMQGGFLLEKCGEERACMVTSVRKAVNFHRVIIHVINVRHSSNNCHRIFNKLPCNIGTIPSSSASFLQFLHTQGICSSVEFCDTLLTCKLGAAKYGERAGPANQV